MAIRQREVREPQWKGKLDFYNIRRLLEEGWRLEELPLRVAYYTRVSTDEYDQLNSLSNQKSFFEEYIENVEKWTMYQGYWDEGISGTSVKKRKAFLKMYDDAIKGKFDLIIMKEVSRFARNTLDGIFYARELKKADVNLYFKNDNFSFFDKRGEDELARECTNAQRESSRLSDRVKFGFERSVKKGVVLGNDRMWGYDKSDGRLTINEEEAKIVRKIYELYSQGFGMRLIGKMMYEKHGYVSNTGKPFSYSTINSIITNPKYKGYYVGGKSQKVEMLSTKIIQFSSVDWTMWKDEDGDTVPQIIDEELWEQCNRTLKERAKKMSSDNKTSYQNKYTYSGKIICGEHKTSYWHAEYKYKAYTKTAWQCAEYRRRGLEGCSNPMIYSHELDFIMAEILKDVFNHKDLMWKKLQNAYKEMIKDLNYDAEIKNILGRMEMFKKKKSKLLMYNTEGEITDKEFLQMNREISVETTALEEELKRYESLNDSKKDAEETLKLTKKWFDKDVKLEDGRMEELISKFLDKIELFKSEYDNCINLNIVLKSGIQIPSFYKRPDTKGAESLRLSPITHIDSDKCIFNFTRTVANKPKEFTFNTSTSWDFTVY